MKWHVMLAMLALGAGCATHKSGLSKQDRFDAVSVDEMVANNVSSALFQKAVLCLNARRETRTITAWTNVNVVNLTNATVSIVTNRIVTVSTNLLVTTATNVAPLAPTVGVASPVGETTNAPTDAPAPLASSASPSLTTNVAVSVARNVSSTVAPAQVAATSQLVRTLNNQISATSNHLTISLLTNEVVTMETNQVLNYVTNLTVTYHTNTVVVPTNLVVRDYFLCAELLAPPDFTVLSSGESLVLLVDGVRYGFGQGSSSAAFVSRKGFTSLLYKTTPEVFVAIANAREVRVRLRGVNSVIERTMSAGARQHFREFLLRHFTAEAPAPPAKKKSRSSPTRSVPAPAQRDRAALVEPGQSFSTD